MNEGRKSLWMVGLGRAAYNFFDHLMRNDAPYIIDAVAERHCFPFVPATMYSCYIDP